MTDNDTSNIVIITDDDVEKKVICDQLDDKKDNETKTKEVELMINDYPNFDVTNDVLPPVSLTDQVLENPDKFTENTVVFHGLPISVDSFREELYKEIMEEYNKQKASGKAKMKGGKIILQ